MRRFSKEWDAQAKTRWWGDKAQCSVCGNRVSWGYGGYRQVFRLLYGDGTEVVSIDYGVRGMSLAGTGLNKLDVLTPDDPLPDDALFQCKRCGSKWPLFEVIEDRPHITDVVETHRSQTNVGRDRYYLNNPSRGTVTRKQTFSKEWTQSLSIEDEKVNKTSTETSLKKGGVSEV